MPPLCGLPVNYTVIPATALLGYLVERISGLPFVQYIDKTSYSRSPCAAAFLQPPSPPLADDLAVGYQYRVVTLNLFHTCTSISAAALNTTAADGAFMMHLLRSLRKLAHPGGGWPLHRQHFTHHPKLPGTAGFHERLQNNMRMIEHLGSLRYSSSLTLLPDQNIGILL